MKEQKEIIEYDEHLRTLGQKATLSEVEFTETRRKLNERISKDPLNKEGQKMSPIKKTYMIAVTFASLLFIVLFVPSLIELLQGNEHAVPHEVIDTSGTVEQAGGSKKSIGIGPIVILFLFSVLGFICFYFAFKPRKNDDESFLDLFGYESFLTIAFAILLWFCKKILPEVAALFVFRTIVFAFGIIIFYYLFLFISITL
ncbi:hypothetical protein [Alkalihalobacterium chitinilyticum]|uniref:DUF1129 domain-containing protein n=1 Tax=Alkalihalobacterium chitinilyticum TaxID=2980103 RepID=A0ABT5VIS8_9BACI|nr:hypothetical protein [Alkalihalobacterium chitinilyticum]MDE5415360.1 hypothetical protein [Alkalihalobacterium chitinilyticum]